MIHIQYNDDIVINVNKPVIVSDTNDTNDTKDTLYTILSSIIKNNMYITKCISNKNKDIHSLSYLIDYELSQSDCIKLGIGLEYIYKDFIINQCANLINIKPINNKGDKEKDHLFMDITNKTIFYAELKSNINLDTEKSKATYNKCLDIEKQLQIQYKDYKINMFLVCERYYTNKIIPHSINNKYKPINNNLLGINEYFMALSIKKQFENEISYKDFLNLLAKHMFKFN